MTREAAVSRAGAWLYSAGWLALIAMYAAALAISGAAWTLAVRNAIANLVPDALLGLAVLRLPRFLPWPESHKLRFFAIHLALLVLFLVTAAAGWIALIAVDSLLFTGRPGVHLNVRIIPFRVIYDVLIFCTLAGVAYARRNAEEVREQAERAAKADALRAKATLETLRSQLNPHFILNMFHALVGLVRRDPAVAEAALEKLGDLLRYGLRVHRDGIDEVTLREECAFVDNYLALERLRLADRLRVKVDTASPALDCLVPTFAVQILVENAIRHAIAPRAAGGLLQICATTAGGRLHITVNDEGTGDGGDPDEGSGMGLRLLQERLTALYGADARITLITATGGTSAGLDLPARRPSEDDR